MARFSLFVLLPAFFFVGGDAATISSAGDTRSARQVTVRVTCTRTCTPQSILPAGGMVLLRYLFAGARWGRRLRRKER